MTFHMQYFQAQICKNSAYLMMGKAGSTILVFNVATWIMVSILWVKILKPFQVILMKKTPFEHYCSIFPNVHQNNDKL